MINLRFKKNSATKMTEPNPLRARHQRKVSLSWALAIVVAILAVPIFISLTHDESSDDSIILMLDDTQTNREDSGNSKQSGVDTTVKDEPPLEGHQPIPSAQNLPNDETVSESSAADETKQQNKDEVSKQEPIAIAKQEAPAKPLKKKIERQNRPFVIYNQDYVSNPQKTKLTIVVTEVGLDERDDTYVISQVPSVTTFAVLPTGEVAKQLSQTIRASGREYLLMVPMEPMDYPVSNPGPDVLLTNDSGAENTKKLNDLCDEYSEFMGVMPFMGSRFLRSSFSIKPIFDQLCVYGYCYFEPRYARSLTYESIPSSLPYRRAQFDLVRGASSEAVNKILELARYVLEKKQNVIMTVVSDPHMIKTVMEWIQKGLPESIELVPLSEQMELPVEHLELLSLESEAVIESQDHDEESDGKNDGGDENEGE